MKRGITIIEFYIKEIIKKHFNDDKDTSTVILKYPDDLVMGEAIITNNQILFYGYEYSRNDPKSKWEVEKRKITYDDFKRRCEFAHKIEFV